MSNKVQISELMYLSHGKTVNIYLKDGDILKNVFVNCYHQDEGEDDPEMLEIGNTIVTIDEIKEIEILN